MSGYLYSASQRAFFHGDIHAAAGIPADAVAVSDQEHADLMRRQGEGFAIAPDAEGRPVAIEQPPAGEGDALVAMRARRNRLLRDSDFTQMLDAPLSAEQRATWAAYRQQLRDLPAAFAITGQIDWPTPPSA